MMDAIKAEWIQLVEEASKLCELPTFLPAKFIWETLIPRVVYTAIALLIIFFLVLKSFDRVAAGKVDPANKYKVCYQFTNFCFNVCIGCVGLYLEYGFLAKQPIYHARSMNKVAGLEYELYLPAALQLGYQIFAIPIGIYFKTETPTMLLHHVAVIFCSVLSGFFSLGFRYYIPFFLGIFELSSIPLAVVNLFKDNPSLAKAYPRINLFCRLSFALSFLAIRWYMDLFRMPIYLRDNFIMFYTLEIGFAKFYLLFQFLAAAFLTFLQIYWGLLVSKGMIKFLRGGKKSKKA